MQVKGSIDSLYMEFNVQYFVVGNETAYKRKGL